MEEMKKLQNGSDIRGVALAGTEGEHPNLTADEAVKLARGFLVWLVGKTGKSPDRLRISIGRDPRLSGKTLQQALTNGFGPYGAEILDCGLATTPAMYMSTRFPEFDCDGAIMITASHLPANRNGFKFFDRDGGLNKGDITAIIETAMGGKKALAPLGPPVFEGNFIMHLGKKTYPSQPVDLMEAYSAHLRSIIKKGVGPTGGELPLKGMKILVDAGNGSGGFYANKVLAPLGADVTGSQYLSPDGTFPNHAPNPEDKAAMSSVSLAVLSAGADLGLIFDTDVDRSAAVDHCGLEISRNRIVALAAALVAPDHPGATVVTDSITSNHLTDFIENTLGLKHLRFQRGYKNVINKALALNAAGTDCPLAIETSGHAALRENFFLDDGAYLATRIVIKAALLHREGQRLEELLEGMADPAEEREVRMKLTCPDFGPYGDRILADFAAWAQTAPGIVLVEPNYEGVRLDFYEEGQPQGPEAYIGWCLLRKSLHDPLMPLNLEADQPGGCMALAGRLREFLSAYDCLDSSAL